MLRLTPEFLTTAEYDADRTMVSGELKSELKLMVSELAALESAPERAAPKEPALELPALLETVKVVARAEGEEKAKRKIKGVALARCICLSSTRQ